MVRLRRLPQDSFDDGVDIYEMGSYNPVARVHPQQEPRFRFPHCDARIVHAPGACDYCDDSGLQAVREAWGINFTGQYDPDKFVCPAEVERSLDDINRWGPNNPQPREWATIPSPEEVKKTRRSLLAALKSLPRAD